VSWRKGRKGNGAAAVFLGWLLGFLIATFSIATLIYHGIFTHDPSAPVQALLDAYHDGIGLVFDPIEPYVRGALHWLGGLIGWDVELHPHWRHVFLLSMVLFLAIARVLGGAGNLRFAALVAGFGLLGSLAGALIAGSVPLGGDARSEAVILWAPLAALLVALFLAAAADAFLAGRRGAGLFFLAAALGSGAIFAFLAARAPLPLFDELSATGAASPGLLALGLFVIYFALSYLALGAVSALFERGSGARLAKRECPNRPHHARRVRRRRASLRRRCGLEACAVTRLPSPSGGG
jgi:hypothetical protein